MAKDKSQRPRVFVGSSSKSRALAYGIQQNLDDDADVTVWDQNVFQLTKSALESLLQRLDTSDVGIFVFAPDDLIKLQGERLHAVRDNVVFELGLFMGRLGRQRTFVVAPKGQRDLRIPTDLLGVTVGRYNARRQDGNKRAALGPFCYEVREQLRKLGALKRASGRAGKRSQRRPKGVLRIVEALYGAREHRVNVASNKLNSLIRSGKLHVYVGNQLGGDPCPGTPKDIQVKYVHGRAVSSTVVAEGQDLTLPPSRDAG